MVKNDNGEIQPWRKTTMTEPNHDGKKLWEKATMVQSSHGGKQSQRKEIATKNNHGRKLAISAGCYK